MATPSRNKPSRAEKAASRLVRSVIRVQETWTRRLGVRANRWSLRRRKWGLLLFCGLAGGLSLYVTVRALTAATSGRQPWQPGSFSLPRMVFQQERHPQVTPQEEERIRYRRDSLQGTPGGPLLLDSLFTAKPGLQDSLRWLENVYSSPKQ